MIPERPSSTAIPPPRREWSLLVLCLALIVALVVIVAVKACPPVPAPAGKPAEGATVIEARPTEEKPAGEKPATVIEASKPAPVVIEIPAAEKGGGK